MNSSRANRLKDPLGAHLFQMWLTRRLYRMLEHAVGKLSRDSAKPVNKAQFVRLAVWRQIQGTLTATEIDKIDADLRRDIRNAPPKAASK